MLLKMTTAIVLSFATIAPAFAQGLDTPYRRNTYNQNFRAAPSAAARLGQPSTGQPAGVGAPAPTTSGSYGASYSGAYSNSYSGSYVGSYSGTYGGTLGGR